MYPAGVDPYCYPGTSILINKAALKDQILLDAFELEVSSARMESGIPVGEFDFEHFRRVHLHIFQDVYAWAGELRTIRISKGNSMFCYPENIRSELVKCSDWLTKKKHLRGLSRVEFAADAAHFLSEVNAVHAFREGNGRTQLSFLAMLAKQASHPIELRAIDPGAFMATMIASFDGDETLLQNQIIAMADAGEKSK